MAMIYTERRDWFDIGHTAVAVPCPGSEDHVVDVRIFTIVSTSPPAEFAKDGLNFPSTPDIDSADVYLSGSIKWDGCSNWHFDAQDDAMLHFCSRKEAGDIGELLRRLYDLAAEIIPEHRESILGI